ncbi:ClpP/crotonase-like domain-containing protein [Limtongia smithiae]|uniref:ClpP/crotonase-like domain-containing protein n=1 Tax=Limtongia smithiae TaxID=1125753 RepID=UPI0034CD734F
MAPVLPIVLAVYEDRDRGSVTISKAPSNQFYLLTFAAPPDNRLTPHLCRALLLALDIIETELLSVEKLPLVTTSAIPKFYSNGLDLQLATDTPGFWNEALYPLFKRFLEYGTPCIAMINGHAFAGGLMTAMCQDYRIMNPSRGFVCLNELEFGAPLKAPMSAIFREKLTPKAYQKTVLEATRYTADMALDYGLVDAKGVLEDVDAFIKEKGLVRLCKSPSYGVLKKEMWRDIIKYCIALDADEEHVLREDMKNEKRKTADRLAVLKAKM